MIFISKLFTALLLPPGCIFLGLIIIIFFIPRKFKIILALAALLLYVLSIRPVSDLLLRPLEDACHPLQTDAFTPDSKLNSWPQAIVVLGGGTIQGSPETGQDTLSAEAVKRAVYAFTLHDMWPVPVIFSGGKVFEYGQDPEAVAAGRLYDSLGLPAERFIAETESRNTWENARETAKLGINQAILVTSAYHMKRSVFCFEQNGISVIPAPTDYKCARSGILQQRFPHKYDFFSFMPSMGFLKNTWLALHEYIGLVYYRIAYRNK